MRSNDLSNNQRIASLTRLMQALEGSRTPSETLRTIRRGLEETYGPTAVMMLATRGLPPGEFRVVEMHLSGESSSELDWNDESQPILRGGLLADIIGQRRPQLLQDVDWSDDPHFSQMLAEFGSIVAIPFRQSRLPMDWLILMNRRPAEFSEDDLEQSMLRSILIGSLLESQTLAEDLALANAKIDADIQQVADLQRSLLPDPMPDISGVELAASYLPSGSAGGDWYDLFSPEGPDDPDGRWCLFIADVSGHGLGAAVVMAMTQAILRAFPTPVCGPAELLEHANRSLCRMKISGFATAFLGIYEPRKRRLVYSSAGHPPPLLRKSDGQVIRLDAALTYPMGIDVHNGFEETTVQLKTGDTVLLYTDGITEARGVNREFYDVHRLATELAECGCAPRDLIQRLRNAVVSFQRGQKPVDDQTMLAIRLV